MYNQIASWSMSMGYESYGVCLSGSQELQVPPRSKLQCQRYNAWESRKWWKSRVKFKCSPISLFIFGILRWMVKLRRIDTISCQYCQHFWNYSERDIWKQQYIKWLICVRSTALVYDSTYPGIDQSVEAPRWQRVHPGVQSPGDQSLTARQRRKSCMTGDN